MDGGGPLIQAVTSRLGIGQENKQSFLGESHFRQITERSKT